MVTYSHFMQCHLLPAAFFSRHYVGTHIFPDVLLNDIAGPDGSSLLLSLKLSVDVLVSDTINGNG